MRRPTVVRALLVAAGGGLCWLLGLARLLIERRHGGGGGQHGLEIGAAKGIAASAVPSHGAFEPIDHISLASAEDHRARLRWLEILCTPPEPAAPPDA